MLPEQAAAMSAAGAPRYSILLRIEGATTVFRLWAGIGDLAIPADEVEDEAATYLGMGVLGEIPSLRQLIGGAAERLDFALTVPTGEVFDLGDEDVAEVDRAPVAVGLIFFDADWGQSEVAWLWAGTADSPAVTRQASGLQVVRQVKISAASLFTDRTRAQLMTFTDADQKRRSPTDTFCARVGLYTQGSTAKWPA